MNQTTPNSIVGNAKQLLTSPGQFFTSMPKSGGFGAPILFIVAMAVSAALLCALGSIPGQGFFAAIKIFIVHSVLWSLYAVLGALLAAVIFFIIWKVLGSRCSFEAAFRCTAYTTVMLPVTILLSLLPVIGVPVGILWAAWLLVCASTAAHGLQRLVPALVFIVLGLLAIWRVCSCNGANADDAVNGAGLDRAPVAKAGAATELKPVKALVIAEPAKLVRDPAEARLEAPGETATSVPANTASDAQNVQLKAANAGKALGELAKGVTDMAINVTEDIARGLDKTLQKALPGDAAVPAGEARSAETSEPQPVKAPSTKSAGEPAFSLESAGETVGALVKSLGEVARDAGQEIQNALDRNAVGSEDKTADIQDKAVGSKEQATGSEKVGGENKDASVAGQASPARAADELRALTPEQLGEALGTFINQLNSAASGAAEGFDRGVQAPADAALNYKKSPAQNAGEALGHFLRGFNQAVQELEAQAPSAETER